MSEVIVRMEVPQDCWTCPNGHPDWIYNDDDAVQMVCFCNNCNTEEENKWISETQTVRPSWCPIIGVLPEQHGDLIDRKLLFRDIVELIITRKGTLSEVIEKQKAVIAATERSET